MGIDTHYTAAEAAARLNVTAGRVHQLVRAGRLRNESGTARYILVPRTDVEGFQRRKRGRKLGWRKDSS
jgi:excisionase family DNA binding protein